MDKSTALFVNEGLKELFKSTSHFSICDFKTICELANVIPPPDAMKKLGLMHCVKYSTMSKEMRDEIASLVMETLDTPGFEFQAWVGHGEDAVALPRRNKLLRLMSP